MAVAKRIIAEQADPANVDGRTTAAFPPGPGPTVGKVVLIPNDSVDVGRVVGRKMRTLKHLRKMTGVYARLEKDVPPSVPTRKLTLIGTRAQVAKAADVVHYLRFMNRPETRKNSDDASATTRDSTDGAAAGGDGSDGSKRESGGDNRAREIDLDRIAVYSTVQTASKEDPLT